MKRTLLFLTLAVSVSACKGNSDEALGEDSATPLDEDCDPNNPGAGSAQEEIPYNGVDDDCDPLTPDDDLDADGFEIEEDCNDENADIYPGAYENCDGVDENCDGQGDAGSPDELTLFADADADGYGDILTTELGCEPNKEWVADNTDCDDTRADVNPGVEEVCGNRTDDNCDDSMVPCEKLGEFSLDDCAVKILGADAGHLAGWGFNAVGDVNGDGLADLAIAATHGMETSDGLGEVYLVDGQVDGHYDLSDPTKPTLPGKSSAPASTSAMSPATASGTWWSAPLCAWIPPTRLVTRAPSSFGKVRSPAAAAPSCPIQPWPRYRDWNFSQPRTGTCTARTTCWDSAYQSAT